MLAPWKKSCDQPRQHIKKQRHYLADKGPLLKAMFFPAVMYGCESWTIKKAEPQGIDAFKLWCWRRLLRIPWTARRSNQSILKEISPEYSLEGLMLKLQYFGCLIQRAKSLEKRNKQNKLQMHSVGLGTWISAAISIASRWFLFSKIMWMRRLPDVICKETTGETVRRHCLWNQRKRRRWVGGWGDHEESGRILEEGRATRPT